ncbi:MAG TPA: ParA family protein [candidate division Zixibacteria bacterium]|jgi:chromosome partitioning protein|nr:ParA family protein [candidate division Zixibacteria bacterium]HBZ00315.1 ParA family protein [candidate division Zixibacteria bacterium]
MIKLAILTAKGGTGKTTTAINLGHGLALSGHRVLIVDCDPQGSASAAFDVNGERGLADLLLDGKVDIFQVRPHLYLLPSGRKRLAELEIKLAARSDRLERLKNAMARLSGCDWVILDCSPSINIVNLNALGFAEKLLIPSSLDYFSLEGVKSTIELSNDITANGAGKLEILGILPTFYDKRTSVSRLALETLRNTYGKMVFDTEIRLNAEIKKSQWYRKTVFEFAPYSHGAYDYFKLAREVLERIQV